MSETEFDWEVFQEAFSNGCITLEQFIEVLISNFGEKETRKIIKKQIRKAEKNERKRAYQASRET